VIAENQRIFQWMEVIFDFVFKMYSRISFVRKWMQEHHEVWEYLGEWLERNKEPPAQYGSQQAGTSKMNKQRGVKLNPGRYDKQKNLVLYYYRSTIFNSMLNNRELDLSGEPDLDTICVQDYKFIERTQVDVMEDRFGLSFQTAYVV